MSDRFATYIRIGGPIPSRFAVSLAEMINRESLSLDWGCGNFSPTNKHDLITAVDSDGLLFLCNDQVPYDYFEILETFLCRHHIAFDRHTESKYEYDAELVSYRPGMRKPFIWTASQNGEAFISRASIASALTLLGHHKTQQALRLLRQAIGPDVAPLQPLSFIGRARQPATTIETNVLDVLGF